SHNVWMKPQPAPRPPNMLSATPSAFITNAGPSTTASWFPDSGASYHVTSDPRNLQQSAPFEGHDQIYIGNGQGLTISSTGTNTFPSPLHPNHSLKLNNLLLVPSITKNLISATDAVLLKGRVGCDGLYEFPDLALHSAKSLPSSSSLPSVNSVSSCTDGPCLAPSSHFLWHLSWATPLRHSKLTGGESSDLLPPISKNWELSIA
ncbi:retrovirus-related pol polyprotein from transposon TNT 1-94, partial [Trifolium medium]|nr:retrovirus-related pol polyprotein from transposon TNT 1-94 [Trifolium medium]